MQAAPVALADAPEALRGSSPQHAAPVDRGGIAAAVVGNAPEFYDFLTCSFFALYIGRTFFPSGNALAGMRLSLATFGIGFFTRPLGGVLVGAYADRAGRRPALMLTIFLMAIGTLALSILLAKEQLGERQSKESFCRLHAKEKPRARPSWKRTWRVPTEM